MNVVLTDDDYRYIASHITSDNDYMDIDKEDYTISFSYCLEFETKDDRLDYYSGVDETTLLSYDFYTYDAIATDDEGNTMPVTIDDNKILEYLFTTN